MQPKESDAGGGAGVSQEEKASKVSASFQQATAIQRPGGEDSCGPTHNGHENRTRNNNRLLTSAREHRAVVLAQY